MEFAIEKISLRAVIELGPLDQQANAQPTGPPGLLQQQKRKFVATIINSTVIIIGRQRGQCDIYIFLSRVECEGYLRRSSLVHKINISLELRAPN